MLQKIREGTQGWITWIIISLICVTFALWGIGNYLGGLGEQTPVAKVNGQKITQHDLAQAYRYLLDEQRWLLGNKPLTDQQSQQLRQVALERLIRQQVVQQAAIKQGFRISSQQVQQAVLQIPALQKNGEFSPERYQQFLAHQHGSETLFLERLRQDLLTQQVLAGFVGSAFSLPYEVLTVVHLAEQQRNYVYAIVPISRFHAEPISDQAIEAYYQEHQHEFATPEQLSINYIELDVDAVKTYQQKNQIDSLAKAFAEMSEQLADLSYEHPNSLKTAADNLGLTIQTTGLFSRDGGETAVTKNPEVLKAAFSDDVIVAGYNSEVINLDKEHQLVLRKHNYLPSKIKPLAEVRELIIAQLKAQSQQEQVAQTGEQYVQALQQGERLSRLAKLHQLTWEEAVAAVRANKATELSPLQQALNQFVLTLAVPTAKTKPTVAGLSLANGDYAIVALQSISSDTSRVTSATQSAIETQLAEQQGYEAYQAYVNQLMSEATIKRYPLPGSTNIEG